MKTPPKPSRKEKGKKPGKPQKKSSSKQDRLFSILIFAFAFLLYANTLNHSYALDDDVVYLKNKDVQAGTKGISSILHHSFIYGFTGHNDQSYRPVVLIIFAIEKQLFGNDPHTGHLINVILFALACVLLYKLMTSLLEKYSLTSFSILNFQFSIPLIVTLLFAAHPIHTESVANIKGRDDILNFIFFELSLYYILKHIDTSAKKYFAFSVLFFFLSLLCKEMAVTFLAVIPLSIFFFRDVPVKKIGMGFLSFLAAFGVYMLIRRSVLETVTFAEKMKVVNNALAAATNEPDRIATALLILGKYIKLLFFPHPLSWDYSFNEIPIVSFSDLKVITVSLIFIALLSYSAYILLKRANEKSSAISHQPSTIFAFSILFFFLTMSVVSNLFIMIGATLGERFLFTPSLAFCMAVPFLLNRFGKNILIGATLIILALFSYKTYTRNKDWKDNFSLFLSSVEATPNSSRVQSSLGASYREMAEKEPDGIKRGNLYGQAITQYKKAVDILPENTEALYNLGVCYYAIGDRDNALKVYEQALKVTPEYTNAANNAGVIYFERKEYEKAKTYFEQALKYDPNNSDALGNLGAIHHNLGRMKEAVDYYKRSLALNPANQNIRSNLEKAEAALKGNQ